MDHVGAVCLKYPDNPELAVRCFDEERAGVIIGDGGGMLLLEELEHAKKRGAKIYAEIVGYHFCNDAYHLT